MRIYSISFTMSPVDPITESVTKIGGVDISSNDTPRNRETVDIEHAYVRDDPRLWSKNRKVGLLDSTSTTMMILISMSECCIVDSGLSRLDSYPRCKHL